jgi:hypothetical protein
LRVRVLPEEFQKVPANVGVLSFPVSAGPRGRRIVVLEAERIVAEVTNDEVAAAGGRDADLHDDWESADT